VANAAVAVHTIKLQTIARMPAVLECVSKLPYIDKERRTAVQQ
jgi:hypothetical protein